MQWTPIILTLMDLDLKFRVKNQSLATLTEWTRETKYISAQTEWIEVDLGTEKILTVGPNLKDVLNRLSIPYSSVENILIIHSK